MSDKPTLPPGVLPGITDTDPPPIHEDTVYGPPAVVDVPMVSQEGTTLSCTMGIWTSKPTAYAYQWQIDGGDMGDDAPTYETGPSEQGKQATCIVTATNDLGSTAAPPSNAVTVNEATRHRAPAHEPEAEHDHPHANPEHPEHHSWLERMGRHGRQEQHQDKR